MPQRRDYYEILQVERSIDDQGLKKAFRKLAMEFHPDRNPSPEAAEKFREAQEAYEVLSDSQKRGLYDQFGHDGLRNSGYQGFSGGFGGFEDVFSGFQSIFDDFFGNSRSESYRGNDLLYRLDLSFREAVLGCSKEIEVERREPCQTCHSSGAAPGSKVENCESCGGRGKVTRNQGFFVISQTCPVCRGEGKRISKPCPDCKGARFQRGKKRLDVEIPAGVDTGVRLRITGEGEWPERGTNRGDLFVEMNVEADENFERDGIDLYTRVYVPFPLAVLGGEIEVKTLESSRAVKVPEGMKAPFRTVLKAEGVKDLRRNRRGDLVVEMHIATPENLSSHARELIEQLKTELGSETPFQKKTGKKKKGLFR